MTKLHAWLLPLALFVLTSLTTMVLDVSLKPFIEKLVAMSGPDTAAWAEPVIAAVSAVIISPWAQYGAAAVLGALVWEALRPLIVKGAAPPPASAEIQPMDWRTAYRRRVTLEAYEAACLAANELPARPLPVGAARSLFADIKSGVVNGRVRSSISLTPAEIKSSRHFVALQSGDPKRAEAGRRAHREDKFMPSTKVDREEVAEYLSQLGHTEAAQNLRPR